MNEENENKEMEELNDPFCEQSTTRQAKESWNLIMKILNKQNYKEENYGSI